MFNEAFLEYCRNHNDSSIKNLTSVIETTLKYLENKDYKSNFKISHHNFFEKLMMEDTKKAEQLFWTEIDERTQFVRSLIIIKFSLLIKQLIPAFNSMNFYAAVILTRSMFENAAVFYKYQWTLLINYSKWNKEGLGNLPDSIEGIRISKDLENFLIKFSHGTRNKSLIKIGKELHGKKAENWYNDNILDYFDFWAANKDFSLVRDDYDYISDICHPSALSNMMFQINGKEEDNFLYTKFDKDVSKSLLEFMPVIASAIIQSCAVVNNGVEQLEKINFSSLL
tara:strand:+ start:231 stop:1076 length:846 start_codon:yes stop_codon:yes gene_type:complete